MKRTKRALVYLAVGHGIGYRQLFTALLVGSVHAKPDAEGEARQAGLELTA